MPSSAKDQEEDWRVLIVEDDPEVTYLHRQLIARTPGFTVVGNVTNNEDALDEIAARRPHLLLLDLTLRGADGVALLRRLRGAGVRIEAIAVTASRRAEVVRTLVQLGVIDYLVKPFTPERLHLALSEFRRRNSSPGTTELSQEQVDALRASDREGRRWLPKGLSEAALERVRTALAAADAPITAAEIADTVGMARVTARRYLEYLVTTQQAGSRAEALGPGRPRKVYWADSS